MKRRGFLKALFAAPVVAKVALSKPIKEPKKTIVAVENDIYYTGKYPPREGQIRPMPLEATGISGDMCLAGNEETPQTQVFKNGKWQ